MEQNARIRRAESKDIPKISDLLVQVDMVHHNGRPDLYKGPATKYTPEQLEAIFKNEKTPVFVCVDAEDTVMGYAFCIHEQILNDNVRTDVQTLYIDDICVDEACRGKRVGSALCDAVLAYAREEQFHNVTLNVWACNPGAKTFYEKMGFVPQKTCMEIVL